MPVIGKTEKKPRGRPATGRDPSITVRLPAALLEWIDGEAAKRGAGRSETIRRLIEKSHFSRRVKPSMMPTPQAIGESALNIITAKDANRLIDGRHYLGGVEYAPRFCVATPERDAVAVFSPPIASHFKRIDDFHPLELARLWQADGVARPLSQFLSASLRWLRKAAPEVDCVFSYADPTRKHSITQAPHRGTIYRAANFTFIGESRATDYWRTPDGEIVSAALCYRRFETKSRAKIQAINPRWTLVRGEPKLLFVYGLQRKPNEVRSIIKGRYG